MRDWFGDLRGRALWAVLGCLVCQMGLGFGYGLTPLAPAMLEELGWSRALFASLQSPQAFVIALASPLVGFVCGRFGARGLMSISAVLLGAGYALIASVKAPWQLALAWGVIGLGVAGLGDIAVGAVVTQWTTRARGLALGLVYTGSNFGGFVATHGMGALAEARSWRAGVAAAALAAFAVLLPAAWFAVRDAPTRTTAAEDVPAQPAGSDLDLDVRAAVRTRSFWIVAAGLTGFWVYLYALLGHFGLLLVDRGVANADAVAYWGAAVGMGMFSKIAFGWLADRMPAQAAIQLDYGLLAASSLVLLAVTHVGMPAPELVWSFVVVFGFSYAARDVVTPLIIAHCFGSRNLAQIYGVLMLTILIGPLGGTFAGWVFDQTGSYQPAFISFAVTNAATFALLFAVRDERTSAQLST